MPKSKGYNTNSRTRRKRKAHPMKSHKSCGQRPAKKGSKGR